METSSSAVFRDRLFFNKKETFAAFQVQREDNGNYVTGKNESDDGSIVTRNVMDVSFRSHAAIKLYEMSIKVQNWPMMAVDRKRKDKVI